MKYLGWLIGILLFLAPSVWADHLAEVQVKTSTGAPTNSASQGTLSYNTVDNVLYVNTDGGTTWKEVGVGSHVDTGDFNFGTLTLISPSIGGDQLVLNPSDGSERYELNVDTNGFNFVAKQSLKPLLKFDANFNLYLPQLNCSSNVNGGVLSADSIGHVTCLDRSASFPIFAGMNTSRAVDFYENFAGGSATTNETANPMPFNMTCYNFRASVDDAPAGSTKWEAIVQESGSNTTLGCTISGAATTCSDLVHYEPFAAGNVARVFFDAIGSVATTTSAFTSMECVKTN